MRLARPSVRSWRKLGLLCLVLAICCLSLVQRLGHTLVLTIINNDGNSTNAVDTLSRMASETMQGIDDGSEPTSSALAGDYMAERHPANTSFCRWQYGLPTKLNYMKQQLIGSPGSPELGNRVLPFALRAESNEKLPQLSLCTHATAEQVYNVVELARRWEGPISLAVFAPGSDARLAVELLDLACHCEPSMTKVSVHLIFPRAMPSHLQPTSSDVHIPDRSLATNSTIPIFTSTTTLSSKFRLNESCSALELQRWASGPNSTERRRSGLAYPINVARNVARSLASTRRVLVSDVELLPSARLASHFLAMLRNRQPNRSRPRLVFVLPAFEVRADTKPPENKAQLLRDMRSGRAVYFHKFMCSHCQKFPGLSRWVMKPDPGRVKPLIITRREYPHNRWEPVFIGTKHDPLYTEEMSWEGRQDKMTQMLEMCLIGYRLIILDGAFLVHRPGIKRRPATQNEDAVSEIQRAHERQNSHIYQQVAHRLLKQYPPNRKCSP
ncbi:hypothetical protein QAD02_014771 [Eretmocerus hayati]|uniref:Uncharacterized protein n=1 Tax=Eretmocerus hayati TaxID=131215 RepID=A0ACC2P5W9_9HYME|nr:hypothetical protein QAD02_014771 [Eretmocerus hayati]